MRWIFLNGELVEQPLAKVSALDQGLLYGYGLFETMRSYAGRVFRLEEHHRRLCEGAARLALAAPITLPHLKAAIDALLERNGLSDAYVRLTVTAGTLAGLGEQRPQVLLYVSALMEYPEELYRRGMAAVISPIRRNETSPLSRIKSLNYLDNLLAREEARQQGADEAILLNSRGAVAEGSASNLFLVKEGWLVTPAVESGALPGIARGAVLGLATAAGLKPEETEVATAALLDASEAFLTNSLMEVMPLTRLDSLAVGTGRPGPLTERLHQLYRELALREEPPPKVGAPA